MQSAREHHFFFAKKMLPTHMFRSTDQVFRELTGPKREAFLMFLWQEAGKGLREPLPHVDVATMPGSTTPAAIKLEVIGAINSGGTEVIVISMPPTKASNEAMFVALVRGPKGKSVFYYERCMNQAMNGLSETEAVLAEIREDQSRSNYGFKEGLSLEHFKTYLGEVLGISLVGLETSLPPITMEAFLGAGSSSRPGAVVQTMAGVQSPGRLVETTAGSSFQNMQAQPASTGFNSTVEKLLLIMAALPVGMWIISRVLGGLFFSLGLWTLIDWAESIFALVVFIYFLVWLHRSHLQYQGQTTLSPGMAVGGFFIPFANFVLPPLAVGGLVRAACGKDAWLGWAWWGVWIVNMIRNVLFSMMRSNPEVFDSLRSFMFLLSFPLSMLIEIAAYGLLWYIVRRVNTRT